MIYVSAPNPIYVAKGVLKTPVRMLGLSPFKKPLEVSEQGIPESQPETEDFWMGKARLVSVAIQLNGKSVVFDECVMTVTQERNIVSTALQGRNGTIKEYISDGDYQIDVAAAIQPAREKNSFAPPDRYPLEELEEMLEMLRAQESLVVQSDFLDLFGVHSVVVKSYSIEQETHSNRQSFRLTLLSDSPYEIKLKEDNVQA